MAFVSTGQKGTLRFSVRRIGVLDVRFLGATVTFFLPAQNVLDIWGLEQPFIHAGLGLGEGAKDHPVKFVREL